MPPNRHCLQMNLYEAVVPHCRLVRQGNTLAVDAARFVAAVDVDGALVHAVVYFVAVEHAVLVTRQSPTRRARRQRRCVPGRK